MLTFEGKLRTAPAGEAIDRCPREFRRFCSVVKFMHHQCGEGRESGQCFVYIQAIAKRYKKSRDGMLRQPQMSHHIEIVTQ